MKPDTGRSRFIPFSLTLGRPIGQMDRVFVNGPGDLGSIPGHVIPKTKNGT